LLFGGDLRIHLDTGKSRIIDREPVFAVTFAGDGEGDLLPANDDVDIGLYGERGGLFTTQGS